jgi:hypothetical protein
LAIENLAVQPKTKALTEGLKKNCNFYNKLMTTKRNFEIYSLINITLTSFGQIFDLKVQQLKLKAKDRKASVQPNTLAFGRESLITAAAKQSKA